MSEREEGPDPQQRLREDVALRRGLDASKVRTVEGGRAVRADAPNPPATSGAATALNDNAMGAQVGGGRAFEERSATPGGDGDEAKESKPGAGYGDEDGGESIKSDVGVGAVVGGGVGVAAVVGITLGALVGALSLLAFRKRGLSRMAGVGRSSQSVKVKVANMAVEKV